MSRALVFLLVVASLYAWALARPTVGTEFSADIRFMTVSQWANTTGTGKFYYSVPAQAWAETLTFGGDVKYSVNVLQRYDLKMQYSVALGFCAKTPISGTMTHWFAWLPNAVEKGWTTQYGAKRCDLWEETVGNGTSSTVLQLCAVDDSTPSYYFAGLRSPPTGSVYVFDTYTAGAPPSSAFQIPKECNSTATTKPMRVN